MLFLLCELFGVVWVGHGRDSWVFLVVGFDLLDCVPYIVVYSI